MLNAVSWNLNNEIFYSADDKCVYKYNPSENED